MKKKTIYEKNNKRMETLLKKLHAYELLQENFVKRSSFEILFCVMIWKQLIVLT